MATTPQFDFAEQALSDAPLDNDVKADLWDEHYSAASPADLEARLANYPHVPKSVKQDLVVARAKHDAMSGSTAQQAPQSHVHRALMDLHRLSQVAPEALAWAEKNPGIARAVIDAALSAPEPAQSAQPASAAQSKPINYHAARNAATVPPDITVPNPTVNVGNGSDIPKLTAAGAIENQPQFIHAAGRAWGASATHRGVEAGFNVNRDGNISGQTTGYSNEQDGHDHLHQHDTPNTVALLHTHDEYADPMPSKADVEAAKKTGKTIMVDSRTGLWEVVPGTGQVVQVKKGTDWMNQKPMVYASALQAQYIAKHSGQPVQVKTAGGVMWIDGNGKLTPIGRSAGETQ